MTTFEDYEIDKNNSNYIFILSSPDKMYHYFKQFNFNTKSDVILDIGSGLGKMLCLVFSHFFKKSIGIEIDTRRYKISKNNIKILNLQNKVTVKNMNVVYYTIPTYVNVFYMYNPFFESEKGGIGPKGPLVRVLKNILDSYNKKPRELHMFFYNPENMTTIKLIQKILSMDIKKINGIDKNIKIYYLNNKNDFLLLSK